MNSSPFLSPTVSHPLHSNPHSSLLQSDNHSTSCHSDSDHDSHTSHDSDHDSDNSSSSSNNNVILNNKVLLTDRQSSSDFLAKRDRTGLVYLSRVPPFMPPEVVRKLLSQYATIGRIYLAPENSKSTAKRKKYKKNGRKFYTEGWIEVMNKNEAKAMALALNNQQVGGKKLFKWHDYIWNMKYLPKFKWHHLTEQIAYERRQHEQRLRAEIMQAKRENKVYLENVSKAKMIEAMENKKRKRSNQSTTSTSTSMDETSTTDPTISTSSPIDLAHIRRKFKQRKVVHDIEETTNREEDLDKVKGVLAKIFG